MDKILKILKKRSFLAVFLTQFLGAFNDNLFRAALSGFVMYKIGDMMPKDEKDIVVTIAVGFFMLPFFLFSALAGEIADKLRKDVIFKITKLMEVIIVSLAVLGFYLYNPYFLLFVLFLMGAQSAFFGPAKYSILPDILKKDELISGNALFEAGTYLAILQGIVIGGVIMSGSSSGLAATSVWIILVALVGFVSSLFIPEVKAVAPETKISFNFLKTTWQNMKFATIKKEIFLCILGISWFWLVGAVIISQIPSYAESTLNGTAGVYTLLLTLFSFGVGLGAITCQMMLKGEITSKYLPITAILMTVFLGDLAAASLGLNYVGEKRTVLEFISNIKGVRISFDLFMLAACGGMFMVPLNAMLQTLSGYKVRSRVIATNNIINSLFMVLGAGICAVLLSKGVKISGIFTVLAVANAVVTVYICGLLPEHLVRAIAKKFLSVFYSVEIKGLQNLINLRGKTVFVSNHTSLLDAVLLWIYLPESVFFAINTNVANVWWIKQIISMARYVTLDPTSPMSVKSIVSEVKKGRRVAIFPEGRITTTGTLMKIYPGSAVIADKTDADILPICIEGSQYSAFAKFSAKFKKRPKSKIVMNILPARKLGVPKELSGKERRNEATKRLYNLMCEVKMKTTDYNKPLFHSLLDAKNLVGGDKIIIEDTARKEVSYDMFIRTVFALGKAFKKETRNREHVGIMLPTSVAVAVTFFGLQIYRRIPCMINFTAGVKNIIASCNVAKIKKIYTSREFVERGNLEEIVSACKLNKIELFYLEDVKKSITFKDKIKAYIKSRNPLKYISNIKINDPAVILFTSGSEGVPKAVVLSHINMNSNIGQLSSVMPFGVLDTIFNAMPVFHSFGILAGMMLPLLRGLKVFMYPTPLHYKIVPELIYDTDSTIMFGTDTFYNGYAKASHPYDFQSIRFAIAGAEKVQEETHRLWTDKFGIRLLEGYGATETSPVLAVNTPMNFKRGTVGQMLPEIEYKLKSVEGIKSGGSLVVRGPNVMVGYLKDKKALDSPESGWYDTGDIVEIDSEGFVTIIGRAKRFAKIAGEMIPLSAIEVEINHLWVDDRNAVVSIDSKKRGETIVAFTTKKDATRAKIVEHFKSSGLSELYVPKELIILNDMPIIGAGKIDYVTLKDKAEEFLIR